MLFDFATNININELICENPNIISYKSEIENLDENSFLDTSLNEKDNNTLTGLKNLFDLLKKIK